MDKIDSNTIIKILQAYYAVQLSYLCYFLLFQ